MSTTCTSALLALALAAPLLAQERPGSRPASAPVGVVPESAPDRAADRAPDRGLATLTVARARAALEFLASDELLGRDTPSPGLTRAGEFLKERYAKAGLEGGAKDRSYFHAYELPGMQLDSSKLAVTVELQDGTKKVLQPDMDVRILRAAGAFHSELVDVATQRAGRDRQPQRPVLVPTAADGPLWKMCGGARPVLGGRGDGVPVLLVRDRALGGAKIAKAAVDVPEPEPLQVPLRNVVALLPGDAKREQIVIVSAHYDHIGVGVPNGAADTICNGADDDATGTVAVLLLAEALAVRGAKLPRTIAFVNFSAEEKGLRGSAAFAQDPPFALANVICNLNLEMLGRPQPGKERQAWLTGRKLSDLEEIVKPALARANIACVPFHLERSLFLASDNASLARQGVVAHSISAGHLHRDYHQPSDEVGKIDFEHMVAVLRGLYHACVEVASRDQVPAWNDAGRAELKR